MATFAQLKQQASRRLQDENNTAVPASVVGDAINVAIKYWKQERFWFNEFAETVTLTIGDPVLPITLLYPLKDAGFRIPYQNLIYDLIPYTNSEYDGSNIDQSGRPYAYTWRAGDYYLYYVPDQAYTVEVTGIRDYSDLSLDADTNDFTMNADQLILYDALSRLIPELRTDPTMAEYYANRALDEKKNLKRRTNKMISTGRVNIDYGVYYSPYAYH